MSKMRAVIYSRYGPPEVFHVAKVDKPVPRDNEILVEIRATSVNSADWRLRKADPVAVRLFFGLFRPRKQILGVALSGVVEAVGKNVTRFAIGDEVFGSTGMSPGAYAEYKCLPETGVLAIKPRKITHEEAAVIPFGGTTALYFLGKADVKHGQQVLIYGASGAVGTAAVQLAKYFGANVTAVCSTANVELVRSLGASKVIDYTREEFTKSGDMYDVIFDTVDKMSYARGIQLLSNNGKLLLSAAGIGNMLRGLWTSLVSSRKVITGVTKETAADMCFLKELIEKGMYKPVIDRTYTLEQMAAAHRYVEKGHKKGNVAIIVSEVMK